MTRIRLNQEYRNKIANLMRVHLEQEDTIEKQNYDNLKGQQIDINDNAWKVAEKIVRRHYTDDDVAKAQYLQDKFENVDTIAKDSCFHFHYMGEVEERDYDDKPVVREKAIEKHFDFRLNGDLDTCHFYLYTLSNEGCYLYPLVQCLYLGCNLLVLLVHHDIKHIHIHYQNDCNYHCYQYLLSHLI